MGVGPLRAAIVVDYQNVHLTGHGLFASTKFRPRHESLVDPLRFSTELIAARNAAQHPGFPDARLDRVFIYRGLPAPEHDEKGYARNQAQRSQWQRDRRVSVTLRPLKYLYQRDATGRIATDATGKRILAGPPEEKGVDVLCALAVVREAREPDIDVVILASSDSDLIPAIDEVQRLGCAKVETCCWYDRTTRTGYRLHPTDRSRPVWNTRMDEAAFQRSWDPVSYP